MEAVIWAVAKLQGDKTAAFCGKMRGHKVTGWQIRTQVFHGTLWPMDFWTPPELSSLPWTRWGRKTHWARCSKPCSSKPCSACLRDLVPAERAAFSCRIAIRAQISGFLIADRSLFGAPLNSGVRKRVVLADPCTEMFSKKSVPAVQPVAEESCDFIAISIAIATSIARSSVLRSRALVAFQTQNRSVLATQFPKSQPCPRW